MQMFKEHSLKVPGPCWTTEEDAFGINLDKSERRRSSQEQNSGNVLNQRLRGSGLLGIAGAVIHAQYSIDKKPHPSSENRACAEFILLPINLSQYGEDCQRRNSVFWAFSSFTTLIFTTDCRSAGECHSRSSSSSHYIYLR